MLDRIDSFLNDVEDYELILLKGHLLIEESLNRINELFVNTKTLDELGLTFHKKALLASDFSKYGKESQLFTRVFKVNKIRNKLAHKLEHDVISDLMELIKEYNGGVLPKSINRKKTFNNSLKRCLYGILGELNGSLNAINSFMQNSPLGLQK